MKPPKEPVVPAPVLPRTVVQGPPVPPQPVVAEQPRRPWKRGRR